MKPKERARHAFKMRCAARDLAFAVLTQLIEIDTTWGMDGYKARWARDAFPLDDYRRLVALLDSEPSGAPAAD
jgi:hypothetical protein